LPLDPLNRPAQKTL